MLLTNTSIGCRFLRTTGSLTITLALLPYLGFHDNGYRSGCEELMVVFSTLLPIGESCDPSVNTLSQVESYNGNNRNQRLLGNERLEA